MSRTIKFAQEREMQKGRNARYWNEFKVGEVIETVDQHFYNADGGGRFHHVPRWDEG